MRLEIKAFAAAIAPLVFLNAIGPPPAFAEDTVRNAAERARDRRELRQDAAAALEDVEDKLEIEILRDEFIAARKTKNSEALVALDARVESYLAFELGETLGEVLADVRELRADRREVRSDRQEIRENEVEGARPIEEADDRRDLRDDWRDRRDDRRDLAEEQAEKERLTAIREAWVALPDDVDAKRALAGKEALLDRLVAMAKEEIVDDVKETREDRREIREDRRETREDRRDG